MSPLITVMSVSQLSSFHSLKTGRRRSKRPLCYNWVLWPSSEFNYWQQGYVSLSYSSIEEGSALTGDSTLIRWWGSSSLKPRKPRSFVIDLKTSRGWLRLWSAQLGETPWGLRQQELTWILEALSTKMCSTSPSWLNRTLILALTLRQNVLPLLNTHQAALHWSNKLSTTLYH